MDLNIPCLHPQFPVDHSLRVFDKRVVLNVEWRMKVMEDFEAKGCHFPLLLKSSHFLFRDALIQLFLSPIPIPDTVLPRRTKASVMSANAPKQHIFTFERQSSTSFVFF